MNFDIKGAEETIGYGFKDKTLLKTAFTHSSYSNEHGVTDNERLEFLGDSVLGLIVSEYLFKKYKKRDNEGLLTKYKQSLVSTAPLSKAVKDAGLHKFLLTGEGMTLTGKNATRALENLFESLVAAIYIDGGMKEAEKFVNRFLLSGKSSCESYRAGDYKGDLQIFTQSKNMGLPVYETVKKEGPDHSPLFTVRVIIGGKTVAAGTGGSKADASKEAAKFALKKFGKI